MKPPPRHPELPEGLARYFDAMEALLFEGGSPEALKAALGDTPSADSRFAFYQRLTKGNPRRVLRSTFKSSRALCDRHADDLFERLVDLHLGRRPPSGWSITFVNEGFADTLESLPEDLSIPEKLDEVVDYEAIRQRLLFLDVGPEAPGTLHPSTEVRSYSFDVPAYVRDTRQAEDPKTIDALGGPITCLMYRHPQTGRLMLRTPTVPELVAIAVAAGEADAEVIAQTGVTEQQLDAAKTQLEKWGALVPA